MGSAITLDRKRKIWSNSGSLGLGAWEVASPHEVWGTEPLLSLDTNDYHNCLLTKKSARALAEAILKWASET